jgi:hypothetical protein
VITISTQTYSQVNERPTLLFDRDLNKSNKLHFFENFGTVLLDDREPLDYYSIRDLLDIDYQDVPNTYCLNVRIEKTILSLVQKNIKIPHPDEIRNYLLEYPDIMNIIEKITPVVVGYFAIKSQISLEVYHDPEFSDSYLIMYVRQDTYKDDIIDRLDKINEEIIRNMTEDMAGWISVTTDFNFPKY